MAHYPSCTSEALYEAVRSRKYCKRVEWEGFKKLLETNIDVGYQSHMRFIMDEAEKREPHKRDKSSRKTMVRGDKGHEGDDDEVAMARYPSCISEALYDAVRSRKKCKQVEWEGCKKLLETNIDAGYQSHMRFIMDEAEKRQPYKRDKSSRKTMVRGDKRREGDDEVAPSMRFHKSMMLHTQKKGNDGQHALRALSAADGFRKRVLDVLRKPFDKEEYTRLRESVRVGNYLNDHPDLGETLVRHRHGKLNCMAILRGFFFWLENSTQEGSFRPWLDPECLAVEPPSA